MRKATLLAALLSSFCLLAAQSWDPVKGPQGSWVYLVVKGYNLLEPKLIEAAKHFGEEAASEIKSLRKQMTLDLAEGLGVSKEAVDLEKPIAVAVGNPMMGQGALQAFVPLKKEKAGTGELVGGYAVLCDDEMAKSQALSLLKQAGAKAIQAPQSLCRIYVDVGTIVGTFAPLVQMQLGAALSQTDQQQQGQMNAQAVMAIINAVFQYLGQIENVVVDLNLTKNQLKTATKITAKPGTDLAQLAGNQKDGTPLGALLGEGMFKLSGKVKGLMGLFMRFTEDFMPKLMADQDQAQKLLALVKNYMSKTGDDFAVAYGFTSEGMQMDMVQRFNGTLEDVRAYYEGMAAQQKAGAFSQLMTGMPGGEAEYIFKRDVRKSNGIPVDLFTMKYKPGNEQSDSPLAQQQLEAIKKIFGSAGFTTEVALLGDTLVMVGGGKDRSARLDRIVKASASLSAPPPKEPIQFSVDLARFLAWAAEIAGSAPPAELKKDLEPLHGTVAFEGRSAVCDVSLPLETISKLAKGIEKLEGQPPQLVPPGGQSQEF